jgi:hypothetical protein
LGLLAGDHHHRLAYRISVLQKGCQGPGILKPRQRPEVIDPQKSTKAKTASPFVLFVSEDCPEQSFDDSTFPL